MIVGTLFQITGNKMQLPAVKGKSDAEIGKALPALILIQQSWRSKEIVCWQQRIHPNEPWRPRPRLFGGQGGF